MKTESKKNFPILFRNHSIQKFIQFEPDTRNVIFSFSNARRLFQKRPHHANEIDKEIKNIKRMRGTDGVSSQTQQEVNERARPKDKKKQEPAEE